VSAVLHLPAKGAQPEGRAIIGAVTGLDERTLKVAIGSKWRPTAAEYRDDDSGVFWSRAPLTPTVISETDIRVQLALLPRAVESCDAKRIGGVL